MLITRHLLVCGLGMRMQVLQGVLQCAGLASSRCPRAPCTPSRRLKFHVIMFNLPLAPPPLSRAAGEGDDYDMPLIARRLAEVMDDVREETRRGLPFQEPSLSPPPPALSRTASAVLELPNLPSSHSEYATKPNLPNNVGGYKYFGKKLTTKNAEFVFRLKSVE